MGPLLILSPALKRRGSPKRQGLCSHLAHLWATSDFPALKRRGSPRRLLRNQQPASPQAILTTPQKNDRVQPFDIFCTLVNYNDKKCGIGFFSVVKVMHAGRQTEGVWANSRQHSALL